MQKNEYNGDFRINYELLGKIIAEKYRRGDLQRYKFFYFCRQLPANLLKITKISLN